MSELTKIRILLIVKEPQKFESQVNFLNRRGWTVACVEALREGIEYIVSNNPDFVLISVNHPNPKVAKMPTVISQTFNCRSILIGEELDSQTAAALVKSGSRDVIHAPVSGPGIQLRIKQIMSREKQEAEAAEKEINNRQKMNSAKATVKREMAAKQQAPNKMVFSASDDPQIQAPSIAEQMAQRSQQAQNGARGPAPAIIQQKSGAAAKKGAAYNPYEKNKERKSNKFADLPPVKPLANEFDFTAPSSDLADAPAPKQKAEPIDSYKKEDELPEYLEPTAPMQHVDLEPETEEEPEPPKEEVLSLEKEPEKMPVEEAAEPEEAAKPVAAENEVEATEEKNEKEPDNAVPPPSELSVPLSEVQFGPRTFKRKTDFAKKLTASEFSTSEVVTILKIIREAFEDSVQVVDEIAVDNEEIFFDGYHINVEGITGFLLYCSKKKSAIESHIVPKINTRIIEGLKQAGFSMEKLNNIDVASLRNMHLNIDGVFDSSLLSMISGGRDEEIVMAYLDSNMGQELIEDKEKGMIGFPVKSIPPDVRSNFKIYLYLPVNKKYYMYLNGGNSFSVKQLQKLEDKGVTHLHCKDTDRIDLTKFFMSRKLYDKLKKSS